MASRILLLMAMVILSQVHAQPAEESHKKLSARVRLSGRVYVRDSVPDAVVRRSLLFASTILGAARTEVRWRVCDPAERSRACDGPLGRREITVQILPLPQRADAALGTAIIGMEGRLGRRVRVFWRGVADVARENDVEPARVLGHVIAHEIGHLLLGSGSHARRGLMRADWRRSDIRAMQGRGLRFDEEQTRRIGHWAERAPGPQSEPAQRLLGSLAAAGGA